MHYRRFGKLDWQASALGFGCMRLPVLDGDRGKIDEPEAARMLHTAIDHGVNYLDTAYGYHDGNSERFLGRALKDGYRDKVKLATKMPCWLVKSADDFDKYLDEQLQKLQTEHIDFYLLHGLDASRWHNVRDLGVIAWAERAIAGGRIRHLGFSFHDGYEAFKEIVDAYDGWTFCQIQYNYMDIEEQAGMAGLKYAAAKGLAVVVMEPLRGGKLANPPDKVRNVLNGAAQQRTPADWALQWLWNQPEVAVALSGMSTLEQVTQNLASASASGAGTLSATDVALIEQARLAFQGLSPIPCTRCQYCMPCPNNVNIPGLFDILNRGVMYESWDEARWRYEHMRMEERASACMHCLECELVCPQKIQISDWMTRIQAVLGEKQPYVPVE